MKDAHLRAQANQRPHGAAASLGGMGSMLKATEQVFMRIPDMRDERCKTEVRHANKTLAPKRKVFSAARRLQFTGYLDKPKLPKDSRGGCHAIPEGVVAQRTGDKMW